MTQIPEKLYFKIGEVSRLTRVKPYVLRYWESEFKIVSPRKSTGNQRVYTRKDVELILLIKRLLGNEKYTLEGAKKKIKDIQKGNTKQLALPFTEKQYQGALKNIRKELNSIKKMLAASY
jgi:DNA-binding transcriptional MerR regulator